MLTLGSFYHLVVLQFCLEVAHVDDHYFFSQLYDT